MVSMLVASIWRRAPENENSGARVASPKSVFEMELSAMSPAATGTVWMATREHRRTFPFSAPWNRENDESEAAPTLLRLRRAEDCTEAGLVETRSVVAVALTHVSTSAAIAGPERLGSLQIAPPTPASTMRGPCANARTSW